MIKILKDSTDRIENRLMDAIKQNEVEDKKQRAEPSMHSRHLRFTPVYVQVGRNKQRRQSQNEKAHQQIDGRLIKVETTNEFREWHMHEIDKLTTPITN